MAAQRTSRAWPTASPTRSFSTSPASVDPFDSQIAFLSTRGGRFKDVYVMSANGDGVRRITNENTINLSPSWAPDGRGLVLTSFRGQQPRSVFDRARAWRVDQAVVAARSQPRRALVARRSPTRGDARVRRQSRDRAAQRRRLAAAAPHRPLGGRRVADVVARRAADRILFRPLGRAADLHHERGGRRCRGASARPATTTPRRAGRRRATASPTRRASAGASRSSR